MKCKNCNAEIEQDAQFCTHCGKDLSKFNKCIKCGELLDKATAFCPYCGTQQPQEVKKTKSKKWIWVVGGVFLLFCILCGAGYFYLQRNNFTFAMTQNTIGADSIAVDDNSESILNSRINEVISKSLIMGGEQAVNTYFSKDFQKLYAEVNEIDNKLGELCPGDVGFWNETFLDGSQESTTGYQIVRINTISESKVDVDVLFLYDYGEYHGKNLRSFQFVNEDGKWVIDDRDRELKKRMAEFVKACSFVGKTYKGNGNGGGLYTEMTITFIDGNKCRCVSDWYQAYSTPKAINGSYEVKGNQVVVQVKDSDINIDFKFDIKDNGRVIEFDNSDPNMGGTMGNDIMSLELIN